jgi:hydrogenase nickel incorporation protein HypB
MAGAAEAPHEHPHGAHAHAHAHDHAHAQDHDHDHDHDHAHGHDHAHAPDHDHAQAPAPAPEALRRVRVERDILEKNDRFAADNRRAFGATGTLALNLVSSPGAGKTSLLVRTLQRSIGRYPLAVIEGDQQTSLDAQRIRATGAPALQINTGKMCHLDAAMVADAVATLGAPKHGVLFIENVGNLVCPAGFDLGEAAKVVLVSVTEGEDKPLKYPDMFHAAGLVVVTKTDLLPHLDFDLGALVANVRRVNSATQVLLVSARTGEGIDGWYEWVDARRQAVEGTR